jgi:pimeloyl-ACP methyl ester carboxylesterase
MAESYAKIGALRYSRRVRFTLEGQELDYEERGEGLPVVFIHGLTTDRRLLREACDPHVDRPGLRRIYLDLPGHGASSANLVGATADSLVVALRDFVRGVAGERAAIVGHSYGAYLALGLARELPTLSGLFLVCPIVQPDVGWRILPPQRYAVIEDGLVFTDDQERTTFDAEVSVYTREVLERFRRDVDPAHRAAHRLFVDMVRGRYAMTAPLSRSMVTFDHPVQVLCGQNDYWAGYEDAVKLVRGFPSCDLRVLSGCGHLLPLERPAQLGAALSEWLGALAPVSPR